MLLYGFLIFCFSCKSNTDVLCTSSYNFNFINHGDRCTITGKFTGSKCMYSIDFICPTEMTEEKFSPYSFDFSNDAIESLTVDKQVFILNRKVFINSRQEMEVGVLSFWDGNPTMCNYKRFILKRDTIQLFKGTFFCNGTACRSYALLIHSSSDKSLKCMTYNGNISFDSLYISYSRFTDKLTIQVEEKDENGKVEIKKVEIKSL